MKLSIAWLLLEKLLRVMNGILVGAAVARHLGPESFGYLSVAVATISVFTSAAGMGADQTNISQLAKRTEVDQLFFNSVLLSRVYWGVLVTIGAVVYFLLQGAGSIEPVYLILLASIPLAAFSLFSNALSAHAEYKMLSILAISGLLLGSAIRLYGLIIGYGINYFAICMVVEASVSAILNGVYLYKRCRFKILFFKTDINTMKNYFNLCLPTAISAALVTIYLRTELFVVLYSLGKESAGLWAAAMMFVTPWGMVANSILPVANQVLAKKQMKTDGDYEKKMIILIRIMMCISIIFVLINIFSVGIFAPILFGKKYASIASIVAICSIGLIPLFMGSVQEIWIAHQKTTNIVLRKVIIGIPISTSLLCGGALLYGLTGVAVAMVLSYFITALLLNSLLDREFMFLQLNALGIRYDRTT
jgi:PST family polysaccharide transporter